MIAPMSRIGTGLVLFYLFSSHALASEETNLTKVQQLCQRFSRQLCGSGQGSAPKEFAHVVQVGYSWLGQSQPAINWWCSGSLISDRFVLTASHCVAGIGSHEAIWVRVGENVRYEVAQKLLHPAYDKTNKRIKNGIALLRLRKSVVFDDDVRPICLQSELESNFTHGKFGSWIQVYENNRRVDDRKHNSSVKILPDEECDTMFNSTFAGESMLCAVDLKPLPRCEGFRWSESGSALQLVNKEYPCTYVEVAMISKVKISCEEEGHVDEGAVGFAKMSVNLPWIESIIDI